MDLDFAPDQPDFYLRDPHAAYRTLRSEDPVHWYGPGPFWCLTKHSDIEHVSRNPQLFRSSDGVVLATIRGQGSIEGVPPPILEMDPPVHNRHRKLVIQAFTPRMVRALEPRIREIARKSLEAVPFGETVDFVERVSVPLPMLVIAEMLGVPGEDRADFKRWSDAMIDAGSGGGDPAALGTVVELFGYFQQHLEARRRAPREDLVSALVTAEIGGERLGDPEILIFLLTLLVAGNETTRNLISGGARALMEFPDQHRKLADDPSLIPNAVEEMLRWVSPVMAFARRATRDTEIRGRRIAGEDYVFMLYASANRDEEVWGADAGEFDVTRSFEHKRHLAFGFGEHLCLGASLARLEARVMFEELLGRFPVFELDGPVEGLPSTIINGVVRMPVVFGG